MLQAPVLAYRRGRGVLDDRDPFSVNAAARARAVGARPTWCSASAPTCSIRYTHWGVDRDLKIVRVDADPDEPARLHKPAVALIGDAAPILRRLIDALAAHQSAAGRRASDEMQERQAKLQQRLRQARRRNSPSSTRSAPNCRRTASSSTK